MGGIFSKPKMPDTSAAMKAQTSAMERQAELLEKQEARLEAEEGSARRTAAASARARRRGGYRLLLSPTRTNAQVGIKGSGEKLGA